MLIILRYMYIAVYNQDTYVHVRSASVSNVCISFVMLKNNAASTFGKLFVLRFYSPLNPTGSCQVRSVYLTTLLLHKLSPLSGLPVLCTFFRQKLTTLLLESAEGREKTDNFPS